MKTITSTLLLTLCVTLFAQKTPDQFTIVEKGLYNEHVIFGQPDPDQSPVYIRQGYVLQYNDQYRIPNWVAYHIVPDYLNTPKRSKKYKYFRTDPDIDNPVKDADYTGSGYARGHLAPYFAMGGDRDGDGIYSDLADESSDPEDDQTVFEANYMSNIAPQDQNALNGSGGPWYALETKIRTKAVTLHKMELNLVLGCIVDDPDNLQTLTNKKGITDIVIPERFYQVIICKNADGEYVTAGFLFPHVREREDLPYTDLLDYLVPVDSIEAITGYDFFHLLADSDEACEAKTNRAFWEACFE